MQFGLTIKTDRKSEGKFLMSTGPLMHNYETMLAMQRWLIQHIESGNGFNIEPNPYYKSEVQE